MAISWYPGHMFKANKELAKLMQQIDVVIEVLDARLPGASSNPLMHKMRRQHHKPCLHILNKADLADPHRTREWLKYLNAQEGCAALANGKLQKGDAKALSTQQIVNQCQQLVKNLPPKRKYTAVIAGIPNVGKSTLLNLMAGRKLAKTGNEPAVTKKQQRIKLNEQWYLFDTPGVLWPKLEDQDAAVRLAASGAIRNTAIVFEDVAMDTAEFLIRDFPDAMKKHYGFKELPDTAEKFMTELAMRRSCKTRHGVDWHRVSEILLHDYRQGKLGRLTLEKAPAIAPVAPKTTPDNSGDNTATSADAATPRPPASQ